MAPKRKCQSSNKMLKVGAKASLKSISPTKAPKPKASDIQRKKQKVHDSEKASTLLGFITKNSFSELTWIKYEQIVVKYNFRSSLVLYHSCKRSKGFNLLRLCIINIYLVGRRNQKYQNDYPWQENKPCYVHLKRRILETQWWSYCCARKWQGLGGSLWRYHQQGPL